MATRHQKRNYLRAWLILSQLIFFPLYFFVLSVGIVSVETETWNKNSFALSGMILLPPLFAVLAWQAFRQKKGQQTVFWSLAMLFSPLFVFGAAFLFDIFLRFSGFSP
jgi:hypothetical protein